MKTKQTFKKNRVFGIIGVGAKMANWNASFNGNPKMTFDNEIYGSDKAIKYSIRNLWYRNGEKVLYFKTMYEKKGEMIPRTLEEQYLNIFGHEKMPKDEIQVIRELFEALDVQNFGAAFLAKPVSIGITGAVQFSQGFNIFADAEIDHQDILSPFVNSSKKEGEKEKTQSSIGKMTLLDEGHYVYPFTVNPDSYANYAEVLGVEGLYTEEAYEKFKSASLKGATALNTVAKTGAYNEFGLFIELKEGSELYLPPLHGFVSYDKEENTLDFSKVVELLEKETIKPEIASIELYVNDFKTTAINTGDIQVKSIFSVK